MATEIIDIDLAGDVKSFINSSDDVDFTDLGLKDKIFSTPDDKLLRVVKIIDSPTRIKGVDVVDDIFDE